MSELLPCPFCGGEPIIRKRMDEDLWSHNIVEWTGAECIDCGIGFEWPPGADPDAIQQWNTRAPTVTTANTTVTAHLGCGDGGEVAGLRMALEEIANRASNYCDTDAADWMPSIYKIACAALDALPSTDGRNESPPAALAQRIQEENK